LDQREEDGEEEVTMEVMTNLLTFRMVQVFQEECRLEHLFEVTAVVVRHHTLQAILGIPVVVHRHRLHQDLETLVVVNRHSVRRRNVGCRLQLGLQVLLEV
jgi:hypothetical protein